MLWLMTMFIDVIRWFCFAKTYREKKTETGKNGFRKNGLVFIKKWKTENGSGPAGLAWPDGMRAGLRK